MVNTWYNVYMTPARLTYPEPLTISEAVHFYLDRVHSEIGTWQERLFHAYLGHALDGKYTYARILVDACAYDLPDEKKVEAAECVIEINEPLSFHSKLRAFLLENGRIHLLAEAIASWAVRGKAAFARLQDKICKIKLPTLEEVKGKILLVDHFGGEMLISKDEMEERLRPEVEQVRKPFSPTLLDEIDELFKEEEDPRFLTNKPNADNPKARVPSPLVGEGQGEGELLPISPQSRLP